jgi:hypothetical protein
MKTESVDVDKMYLPSADTEELRGHRREQARDADGSINSPRNGI